MFKRITAKRKNSNRSKIKRQTKLSEGYVFDRSKKILVKEKIKRLKVKRPKRVKPKRAPRIKRTKLNRGLFIGRGKLPKLLSISISLVLVLFVVVALFIFISKDRFMISNVNVGSLKYINKDYENKLKQDYTNQIFFFVFPRHVEKVVKANSAYVSDVKVVKTLPDSLSINITEREPFFAYINRTGVFIISRDNYILEKIISFEAPKLSKEDYNYLSGNVDLENVKLENTLEQELKDILAKLEENSKIVAENSSAQPTNQPNQAIVILKKTMSEEEIQTLVKRSDELKEEIRKQKLNIVNQKRKDLYNIYNDFWSKNVDMSKIQSLIPVYSYDNNDLVAGNTSEISIFSVFEIVSNLSKITQLGQFSKIVYVSNIQSRIIFDSGKEIIINPKEIEDPTKVSKDISIVIDDLVKKGEDFLELDARGDKIAVKRK